MRLTTSVYDVFSSPLAPCADVALVADLHGRPYGEVIDEIARRKVDLIAAAGDIARGREGRPLEAEDFQFVAEAARLAPTFYAPGNHEGHFSDEERERIREAGAVPLENEAALFRDFWVGGFSDRDESDWPARFGEAPGFKLLICHRPDWYPRYVRESGVDLTLSGHAHGGQIRVCGRGLYAPGQGLLPKYTCGVYENRLVVSRGLANTAPFPRFFNETELVIVRIRRSSRAVC